MKNLKVGLLPLYIKLYDDSWPELRDRIKGSTEPLPTNLKKGERK